MIAAGGDGGLQGGRGAVATADLSVVPGSTLYMNVGGSATAAQGGGAAVAYRLSEPAGVRFGVQRAVPGVRSRGECRPLRGTPPAGAKRCTADRGVTGSFRDEGEAGTNRLRFTGRLRGRPLAPGAYRLVATAVGAAGSRSQPTRRAFRIIRR